MKMRFLSAATLCTLLIIGISIIPRIFAAEPQAGPGFVLSGSNTDPEHAGKFPSVAAFDHTVHILTDTDKQIHYWAHAETATSSSNPLKFGSTNDGDTDYTQAIVSAGPAGQLYAMWIEQTSAIKLKRKLVGGDWGATTTAINTGAFMSYLDVAVTKNGQLFAVWNQNKLYRYSYSSDGGNSWSVPAIVSAKLPYGAVFIAAGGDTVVVAFGSGDGHVYASIWNGSSFNTIDVTPKKRSSDFFASAKPAVGPNNIVYVSFRNVPGGIYYSERKPDGSWPISKLANGGSYGPAGMAVDAQNNIHFSWASDASGRYQAYYAFKPATGDWQGPIRVNGISTKIAADVDIATTLGARAYGHAVFETFDGGGGAQVRYQQFSGSSGPAGTPALDGGAASTNNTQVALTFANVSGSPDSVRTHWDAAPTDADAWRPLSTPLLVDAPAGVSQTLCEPHTLFVQLRAGGLVGAVAQARQTFDYAVQAQVQVLNPHLSSLPAPFKLTAQASNPANTGAPDGDPAYTRERSVFLQIDGRNQDCSNLASYIMSGSDSDPAGKTITNNIFNGTALLPGGSSIGPRTIDVLVKDTIGNNKTYSFPITYDPANTDTTATVTNTAGLPVLHATGSTTVTVDTNNSILRTLSFAGINVTDNLYPGGGAGKQFWGVYIANTRSPTITVDDASLTWFPIAVPAPNNAFSVKWNIFSGLGITADFKNQPGTYYVFVRFLDGAGNPSIGALKQKITLDANYAVPLQLMPGLTR